MIVDENITVYLHSLEQNGPSWLESLRDLASSQGVPVIRKEMESFLNVLLKMNHPLKILEIGTGVGYSALLMQYFLPDARIVTMENYEPRLRQARQNLRGHAGITLMEGDASSLIRSLREPFDFIFLDAAKGQYLTMLPDLKRLLPPGGILLADNVLQEGELIRSRFVTPRRQRTIHERMREFIWEMKHDPEFATSLVTIGDGVILSVRVKKTEMTGQGDH